MRDREYAGASGSSGSEPLVIGLLTSIGDTLDAFFVEIAQRWGERGVTVEPAAGTLAEDFRSPTVLKTVSRQPAPRNWKAFRELRAWVREKRIDVVVTNTASASMLVRAAGVGVPVIYFCHGLHWNDRRLADLPYRVIERMLLSRTAGIVCINSADETWFSSHAPNTPRMRLLGGVGLDGERFVRRNDVTWDGVESLRLVWCGEYSARKNPAAAVDLAEHLWRSGIDVTLDMLGDGALFDSEELRTPVEGLVRHHGKSDVVPFFESSHVLVQTSRWEGLPRVGLEAIAIGLPVVGFDVKGVRDLPAVQVVPCDDTEALAAAVLNSARGGGPELPDTASLSYVHAADSLLDFVNSVVTGVFRRGPVYSV